MVVANRKLDPYDIITSEIQDIKIAVARAADNDEDTVQLKKELYRKMLDRIDIVESEDNISSTQNAGELAEDIKNRPSVPMYMTGTPLDDALGGGIELGTFIQLAGESFTGKTHFVLEVLSNISGHKEVLFFNFEMGDRRINSRLSKLLISTEQDKNFLINSKARKLMDIVQEIKNKSADGVKFFAIDSKMKIEVPEEPEDLRAFRKISHELSKLAQQEEIIIFLINQMNEMDQQSGRLAFKGGGDQMYDTDIALFYLLNKVKSAEPKDWTRTMHCRKNRTGEEQLFRLDLCLDNYGKTKEVLK